MLSQMWGPRFPVCVKQIALEYTKRFPDPIRDVAKANLPSFEGALFPLEKKGGWAILYNPTIRSDGRINYTQAHELGHFFAHRAGSPAGFECGQRDILGDAARAEHRIREREADEFASFLLMPLDDFRRQVADTPMTIDLLKHLADRYGVSFTAAALKWLESTELCSVVVVATNGFINWCSRSEAAKKAGIFYTSGTELPAASIAALGAEAARNEGTTLAAGTWSNDPVREIAIFADHYEMTISLLIFEHHPVQVDDWVDEAVDDLFDRFESSLRVRRSWD